MAFWKRKTGKKSSAQPAYPTPSIDTHITRKLFPPEVKLQAIKALEVGLSPSEVSEIVGSGTSTVTAWARAYGEGGLESLFRKPTNVASRRICEKLEARIEQERRDNPQAGVRRIRDELRRHEGLEVSAETVRRVVNEAGLGKPAVQAGRQLAGERRFEREIPNALWQIDIFTFQLKRLYPVYLVGILDDHSRYIVAHGLFRQQTAEAVLEVVKGAIGQWGAPREILSDNGRQFAAWRGQTRFQKVLKQQGIGHVRSAAHHPMTLGKIERFWKTIWEEFLEEALFASFADASQRIAHWVAYYNHQRPHQGIEGACPADRFYGLATDIEEATRQGCQENALRLALGQQTQPPLYLLGKLGDTDVRVVRKGEEIEIRLGDTIHEVIRMGSPYRVGEDGRLEREEGSDEMERTGGRGEVSGLGSGSPGGDDDQADLPDVWGEPAGPEPGDGAGGSGFGRGPGATEAWQEAQASPAGRDRPVGRQQVRSGEGTGTLEAEVRGGQDVSGVAEEVGARREAARGGGACGGKKEASMPKDREDGMSGYGGHCWPAGNRGDGPPR
jgi:transposase InsO family protein